MTLAEERLARGPTSTSLSTREELLRRAILGLPGVDAEEGRAHFDHLLAAMEIGSPALFVAYARWLAATSELRASKAWSVTSGLRALRDVLRSFGSMEDLVGYVQAAVSALEDEDAGPTRPVSHLDPSAPLAEDARTYLLHLLAGRSREATALVVEMVRRGAPLADVYLHVFQRTQHEIGRLWQLGEITVAQEHYCTAATQVVMAQLQPQVFEAPRNGRSLLAACVAGNMHEIGPRIIVDLFELEGWDTTYLGANTPTKDIHGIVADSRPDVVALSAALPSHLRVLGSLVEAIRSDLRCSKTKIIVGGRPFNDDPGLWQRIGAHGHARDARDALRVAGELLSSRATDS